METLTMLLFIVTVSLMVIYVVKRTDNRICVLSLVTSVCAVGQIFIDTELSSQQVALLLMPMVAVLLFSTVGMMRLKD